MNTLQTNRIVKAVVDGVQDVAEIAARAGVEPQALDPFSEVLERGIQLMRGFYKYGHENMKPAGLPPPPNPYYDRNKALEAQPPEYFAFEAVQRNGMDRERCLQTCMQLGLSETDAEKALDNVCMPWCPANGWRSYVREMKDGCYVLQDRPPAKLKRHLDRLLEQLTA